MTTISTIGIVGAGTMGAGIAQTAASNGFKVRVVDATDEFLQRGLDRIRKDLDVAVERGKQSAEQRDAVLSGITGSTDYSSLNDCNVVIEAVPETLVIKEEVLRSISQHVATDTIIASNTSSLSIATLAQFVENSTRLVGMHFFNPVPRMALVEVVASNNSSTMAIETVTSLAEAMGKTPVRSQDHPGFIVNRILIPMINEAIRTLDDGVASAEHIDTAMKLGAGHPMGPLALADLIGIDVVLAIMQVLESELGPTYSPAPRLQSMVEAKTLGKKSGEGFFTYEEVR